MTTDLVPFTYEGATVRSVVIDGEPWFVVSDAAKILGYRDASNAARLLRPHQQGYSDVSTPSGIQRMLVANEGGVNRLIMRSNAENAEAVQDWFTDVVLPAIRRTGSYSVTPTFSDDELIHRALEVSARRVAELTEKTAALEAKVEADAPKVDAFDELMDANGCYSMNAAAKILGWGRNVMFRELRRLGILQSNNLPYQRYEHHFKVVPGTYYNPKTEQTVPTATPFVRPSGLDYLRKRLAAVTV